MNILITGGSGFVGSYFIEHFDNKYNIRKFSFRNGNLDRLDFDDIDVIIHLSALVHQMNGAEKEEYERINVKQTLDLARKAKDSGVKQFVFMSTVKVYGEETKEPYSENSICNPEDEYGKSKLKAEQELLKLGSDDFRVSIIRTPVVYGYGVKANIKNLVTLVQKVPVLPFGGIQNKRSMIYVGNLCFFVDTIIQKQVSGIFLVSDERAVSTTELIELIAKALEKHIYLIKVPLFEKLLKILKPSFQKRLFENLEVDNRKTLVKLFGIEGVSLPYSVEDGIKFMIKGEKS